MNSFSTDSIPNMVQLNVGFSHKKGTLRGVHYQENPHEEAKFVRCTRGAIYDVLVDLRRKFANSRAVDRRRTYRR